MKILLATQNKDKVREVEAILKPDGYEVLALSDLGLTAEAEEDGNTFAENAEIKAREIYEKLKVLGEEKNYIVIADDSGFCIDKLKGAPGVHSARFMGHDVSYDIKNKEILRLMEGVPDEERGARFECAICAIFPDGESAVAYGKIKGRVAREAAGDEGFGYDPIFFLPEYDRTTAELGNDLKNKVSHRSKALGGISRLIKERYGSL